MTPSSVLPFYGYYFSHANSLCVNTTGAMGDEVDVDVGDGLPCCGLDVDAEVEAVGLMGAAEEAADSPDHLPANVLFPAGQLKLAGAVSLWDDQGMTRRYWELVIDG